MHNARATFARVRALASAENDRLARAFALAGVTAPISALNIIHQQATVAAEVLDFYISWSEDLRNRAADPARRQVEDNQRAITIGKSALVMSLSAIEAAAKQAVARYPCVVPAIPERPYLIQILRNSAKAGLVSKDFESAWKVVTELRNAFVHNNAVPDASLSLVLPGGPLVSMTQGQMLQGSTGLLPEVLLWTTSAFSAWAEAFLSRARAA